MILLLVRFAFLAAVAGAVAAPLQAAPSSPVAPAKEQSNETEAERLFNDYFSQLMSGQYAKALATTGKLKPDASNKPGRGIVAAMRAGALLGLDRDKDAARQFADARELAPEEPMVDLIRFWAGMQTQRMDFAADALDGMLARSPDVARDLDPQLVWLFLRQEPKGQDARNEDRRVALARIGFGGADGDNLTANAVGILLKRGDVSGATELLPFIDEPREVEDLLIQKRYSALWPQIEAYAGPHLEKIRASSVALAEREYASSPNDAKKLQSLVNALRHANRTDEAIALRSKLPASTAAMSSADEDTGWALNNVALALHAAGRAEEADKLFASLNEAPMEKEYWRVSMKINRLELLVADGRFDKALPLIEPTAQTEGTPYAQQLVRRLRYCTMSGLGRKDEAAKLLPEVLKHADDAPGPTIDGLVCAGELDKAEQVALAAVKKETFEGDFVRALQAHPLTGDDPSIWSKGWTALRQRPAIATEFSRLGRDMPESLLPPASK